MDGSSANLPDQTPDGRAKQPEKILSLNARRTAREPSLADLGRWHNELLCALDTIGLDKAKAPTYDDFGASGALNARLGKLCALCGIELAADTPAPTRMHLWLRLTKTYVNAIRAFIGNQDLYRQHYRPRLGMPEHQFVEALSLKRPGRGELFKELLPLAVQDDVFSHSAKVVTWERVRRLATESGSRPKST